MSRSVPSQFHISVCTSEFWRLDWTGAIPPLINTPIRPTSAGIVVTTGFFFPPRPISAQILLSVGQEGGSADKKFSSCFLNSYIIQTHFRMKPEEPPPAPVARQGGGGQPDRSNMFPILSVPLTRSWEWIRSLSPSLFLFYRDIFVWLKSRQHNRVKFRLPLPTCKFSKSLRGFESIWDDSSNVIGLLFT